MKYKNAILAGLIIGIVSALWIFFMEQVGYSPEKLDTSPYRWLEYTSILIPFFGLYFGIKARKKQKKGKFTFIDAIFEGFKIIAVGGFIAAIASFIYISVTNQIYAINYMERIFGAVVIGLLFTLINGLLLADRPNR